MALAPKEVGSAAILIAVCSHDYLETHGAGTLDRSRLDSVGFDNYANVMQAAIDGQGNELLEHGRLLRPADAILSPGHELYLARRHHHNQRSALLRLDSW